MCGRRISTRFIVTGVENEVSAALVVATTLVAAAVPSIHAVTTSCSGCSRHSRARTRHTSIPWASGLITVDYIDRDCVRFETLPEYHFVRPRHPSRHSGPGRSVGVRTDASTPHGKTLGSSPMTPCLTTLGQVLRSPVDVHHALSERTPPRPAEPGLSARSDE